MRENHAFQRSWDTTDQAAADYANAIGMTSGGENRSARECLARVRLAMKDIDGYRRECAELISQSGQTKDPKTAYSLAWTCVLASDAIADREAVVRLAQGAVEAFKHSSDPDRLSLQTLGATTYRAGRFEEAVRHLGDGIKAQGKGGDVRDWLFLAMAHHHLNTPDEARKWLDKAIEWLASSTRDKPKDDTFGDRIDWRTWLELQVLRREAESLIRGSKAEAPPPNP